MKRIILPILVLIISSISTAKAIETYTGDPEYGSSPFDVKEKKDAADPTFVHNVSDQSKDKGARKKPAKDPNDQKLEKEALALKNIYDNRKSEFNKAVAAYYKKYGPTPSGLNKLYKSDPPLEALFAASEFIALSGTTEYYDPTTATPEQKSLVSTYKQMKTAKDDVGNFTRKSYQAKSKATENFLYSLYVKSQYSGGWWGFDPEYVLSYDQKGSPGGGSLITPNWLTRSMYNGNGEFLVTIKEFVGYEDQVKKRGAIWRDVGTRVFRISPNTAKENPGKHILVRQEGT